MKEDRGLFCPKCGMKISGIAGRCVNQTRDAIGGIRRFRTCLACGAEFTTRERIEQCRARPAYESDASVN